MELVESRIFHGLPDRRQAAAIAETAGGRPVAIEALRKLRLLHWSFTVINVAIPERQIKCFQVDEMEKGTRTLFSRRKKGPGTFFPVHTVHIFYHGPSLD